MAWPWEIAERDHAIQNPTRREDPVLGDYLRLRPKSWVLDIALGKAGPAIVLAEAYGCKVVGVEQRPGFADEPGRVSQHAASSTSSM